VTHVSCMYKIESGGRGGIRTHDTLLEYTHFPGVRLRPLGHPSAFLRASMPGKRAPYSRKLGTFNLQMVNAELWGKNVFSTTNSEAGCRFDCSGLSCGHKQIQHVGTGA
jgi:hypothetical protein